MTIPSADELAQGAGATPAKRIKRHFRLGAAVRRATRIRRVASEMMGVRETAANHLHETGTRVRVAERPPVKWKAG